MSFRKIKNFLNPLARLPIHPQWHATRNQILPNLLSKIDDSQIVLDIGCYNKWAARLISRECQYIGLDYPATANNWYFTKPDIYGDAHQLPIQSESIDYVLLLDVLEHIEDEGAALFEISRVLKQSGQLIVQIPFLYPIHDAPRDFRRLTEHGIRAVANKYGFTTTQFFYRGHPLETAAMLKNIAFLDSCINWAKAKNPLCLLLILAPICIFIENILSYLLAKLSPPRNLMPFSYACILKKSQQDVSS